ncbi:retrovirus-related pol polyprotein from transposon TNT 1-94 [Tanacetum coccineum]
MGTFRETLSEGNEGALHLGPKRPRVYSDLSPEDKDRYNADIQATNIILQGLPKDIYSLINHYTDAKDIWDNVNMLLEGSELTKEDRESQLYDDFEYFCQHKGETIHDYYVRFAKLINDMRNIKMTMSRMQLNSKFVNNMLPEWGRFVTSVKLNRGLRDSNHDQLYAYLKQHEAHANKNKMMLDRFTQHTVDPLALMSNGGQNIGQDNNAGGAGTAGYRGALNRVENANPSQARQLRRMEWHWMKNNISSSNMTYTIDEDVDEQPVQDLALNVDNVFSIDDYPVYDKAGPSYDSDILSEVHDHDQYQDAVCEHHEEHEMHDDVQPNYVVDSHADYTSDSNMIPYDQYVKDNAVPVVQSNVSSVPNDAYMMIYNDMYEPHAQSVSKTTRNIVVDNSLTAKLATYKEQVELYERRVRSHQDESRSSQNAGHASRPIKALMVYPPNTRATLVPRVLPTKNSIKITRAKHLEQTTALLTKNESLKVQIQNKLSCVNKDHVKPKVLAPGKYAIDVEPIPPRNRNNREVHLVYLKHLKESVETLREIVEEAKVERPLDSSLASACLYTKHSQELLEYVIGTCPKDLNTRDNKHASTPLPKKKQVTFEEQCAMSKSNTHKPVEQLNCQKTNVHVPPSTGVNSCTDASRSQPRSNTKKNRILPDPTPPPKSVNMKKVEEHPRTIKSSLKTTNHVDSSISSKHTVVQIVLWYLDSGCSKHMTGDRSRLRIFVKKFIGTVRFGNDHFGALMYYGDYIIGESVISRVYYVEGLGHNMFYVGQFCDSDLEVAFRKHSCYVRDTDGVELIKGSRGSNLYTILIEDIMKSSLIFLLSKASKNKSWLWHQRLNHLNFGTINDLARKDLVRGLPRLKFEKDHLYSACQLGKSKKHTHKPKTENTNLEVLNTLHMDLCGPMQV